MDRAYATPDWTSVFPNVVCTTLVPPVSDHSPLQIETDFSMGRTNRRFKFDNSWLLQPDFLDIVQQCWENSRGTDFIVRRDKIICDVRAWVRHDFKLDGSINVFYNKCWSTKSIHWTA